jgi:preprotein translocase subunit SecG
MTLILTTVLVLNCFFLVLLILIQLPKKESGSGLAFGGGTLDMALGAGAGNVLTKLTKVSATLFLLLCLVLAVIGGTDKGGLSDRLAGDGAPATATSPANSALTDPVEATGKAEGAAPSAPPAPTAPEAATPPAAVEKPAETPAAPPKGEEKK